MKYIFYVLILGLAIHCIALFFKTTNWKSWKTYRNIVIVIIISLINKYGDSETQKVVFYSSVGYLAWIVIIKTINRINFIYSQGGKMDDLEEKIDQKIPSKKVAQIPQTPIYKPLNNRYIDTIESCRK